MSAICDSVTMEFMRSRMLDSNVAVIVWKTTPVGEGQSKSLHRRPLPRFMTSSGQGARVFAHGAMGRRIDPSWWTY